MKRLLPLLLVTGCAVHQPQSMDVAIMPNDCANRAAITRWLEQQNTTPRHPLQTETEYAQQRSQIRHRLWTLRYNCQSL